MSFAGLHWYHWHCHDLSLSHGVNQYIEDMEENDHVRISAADLRRPHEYDVSECRYDDKSEIIIQIQMERLKKCRF